MVETFTRNDVLLVDWDFLWSGKADIFPEA